MKPSSLPADVEKTKLSPKHRNLIRLGTSSIQEFIALYSAALLRNSSRFEINGFSLKARSLRYAVFSKSLVCCQCGIQGSFFAIELSQQQREEGKQPHANLYALREDGEEVLMTKDHIIPLSRGGRNFIGNLQTMCMPCNTKKKDRMPR